MEPTASDYKDGQELTYFMAALETMMREHGIGFVWNRADEAIRFQKGKCWARASELPTLGLAHYTIENQVDWKYLLD